MGLWFGLGTLVWVSMICAFTEEDYVVQDCAYRLTITEDTPTNVSSPALTRPFTCLWEVTVSPGDLIQLDWLTFDLPGYGEDGKCHECLVEYGHYDGLRRRVVAEDRRCGSHSPPTVTSPGNTYWVAISSFLYGENMSFSGLSIQIQTAPRGARGDADATVVAICAFLVPLFCAFPIYHCFKRMAEVNKRKRLHAKLHRLREVKGKSRQKSISKSVIDKETISEAEETTSVFYTIQEDVEGEILAELSLHKYYPLTPRGHARSQMEENLLNNNNSLTFGKDPLFLPNANKTGVSSGLLSLNPAHFHTPFLCMSRETESLSGRDSSLGTSVTSPSPIARRQMYGNKLTPNDLPVAKN